MSNLITPNTVGSSGQSSQTVFSLLLALCMEAVVMSRTQQFLLYVSSPPIIWQAILGPETTDRHPLRDETVK